MGNYNWLLFLVVPIVFGFPQALLAVITLLKKVRNKRGLEAIPQIASTSQPGSNIKLIALRQDELGGKSWKILQIIGVSSALPLLAFDGYVIHLMATKQVLLPTDLTSISFLVIVMGLPLLIIVTTITTQFHYWKTGMSWINATGEIVLEGETDAIFDKCNAVTRAMKARIIRVERKPNFIIAELAEDRIIVRLKRIKRIRGKKHRIDILSQCKSPVAISDGGRNRKNVNTFLNDIMPPPPKTHQNSNQIPLG